MIPSSRPVSYTHLDVYKRQTVPHTLQNHTVCRRQTGRWIQETTPHRCIPPPAGGCPHSFRGRKTPVSYTHLGAAARDCGNYLDMNLGMAKYIAGKYLDQVLYGIDEKHLVYPED